MGVMPCNRGNCDNILCDRYSDRYGYICNECFEELIGSALSIEEFLETGKGFDWLTKSRRREDFENEFKKD